MLISLSFGLTYFQVFQEIIHFINFNIFFANDRSLLVTFVIVVRSRCLYNIKGFRIIVITFHNFDMVYATGENTGHILLIVSIANNFPDKIVPQICLTF